MRGNISPRRAGDLPVARRLPRAGDGLRQRHGRPGALPPHLPTPEGRGSRGRQRHRRARLSALGGPARSTAHHLRRRLRFRHDSGAEWILREATGRTTARATRRLRWRRCSPTATRRARRRRLPHALSVGHERDDPATVDFGGAGGALRIGVLPDEPGEPPVAFNLDHSVRSRRTPPARRCTSRRLRRPISSTMWEGWCWR